MLDRINEMNTCLWTDHPLIMVGVVIFFVVMYTVMVYTWGQGKASLTADEYSLRLSNGKTYVCLYSQAITVDQDNSDSVLLLQEYGTEKFRILRVKGSAPPRLFAMVNGKPVEIVVPQRSA